MSKVKAVFRGVTPEQKEKFKDSTCLLTISVGQESHEGERFAATVDLINQSFKGCHLMLYDSLQRYTMALNSEYPPEHFHSLAIEQGNQWLLRNEQYWQSIKGLKGIIRWDEWLSFSQFPKLKEKIQATIATDTAYKIAFDKTIFFYLNKYMNRLNEPNDFNQNRAYKLCFDYLLEECVAFCLFYKSNSQFEIYPNNHNEAILETEKHFLSSEPSHHLTMLTLIFKNAGQIKPQNFELI
jgi:tRNA-dependent cyclodipeptide synthase